jgi:RNA polymerase sigma factor (TIGR02999 family)
MSARQSGVASREGQFSSSARFVEDAPFLAAMTGADGETATALFQSVYKELRELAEGYFRRKRGDDTLQPTALVHEVYLRLARSTASFKSREHFLAVAATAMRQILIDRERRRRARKRGGEGTRVTLTGDVVPSGARADDAVVDVLALDAALRTLIQLSERQARIVELLYFGGLTVHETAAALDLSPSLTEKEWRRARAWLRRELASPVE